MHSATVKGFSFKFALQTVDGCFMQCNLSFTQTCSQLGNRGRELNVPVIHAIVYTLMVVLL